jgi:uncharacterized protein YegL
MQERTSSLRIADVESPQHFCELGVLLLDGSGSMLAKTSDQVTKAEATAKATRELFDRFKNRSRIPRNFRFALITYDHQPTPIIDPPVAAKQLDEHGDYNPVHGHGGGTRIWKALEEAERIVGQFLAGAPKDGIPYRAVILLMTDGLCNQPDRTRETARRIKERFGSSVTIAGAFFSSGDSFEQAGAQLLREIVDDPELYFATVTTGDQLRDFFTRSLSTASGVIVV